MNNNTPNQFNQFKNMQNPYFNNYGQAPNPNQFININLNQNQFNNLNMETQIK